ncbi:MAG: thiamine phosphate synthase [Gammaproteobacteria bacterium]
MTAIALPSRGVYAIADTHWLPAGKLEAGVSAALRGGVVLIQLRDKSATALADLQLLKRLRDRCHEYQVPFLINDHPDYAIACQADGVHIGQTDHTDNLQQLRRRLGEDAIIGVSCHNDLITAQQAEAAGASYVAFGRFFVSQTKPQAQAASLATLREASSLLRIPCVAIGGITPDNTADVLSAGAAMVAVIGGIFNADDIETATRRYSEKFIQPV